LPPVLLVAVAVHQIVLARSQGLSAWSGGGFGMFATLDAGSTRHLHAFVLRPGVRREVRPSEAMTDDVLRMLTLPSASRLRAVAEELARLPTPDYGPARAVEMQVWHTHHDPETLAPASRILQGLRVPLAPD
jgi:hypothetical protein